MATPRSGLLALSALLLGASALAAITVEAPDSVVTLRTVEPPVQFAAGDNAGNPRYMRSFDLSTNATSFTAEVKPKAGANMVVTDVARIVGAADDASVTLTADPIVNSKIEQFEWEIYNGTTLIATFDYLAANPEASFTLPGGQTFQFDLHVDLADGSGKTNAGITFGLGLEVTP